MNTFLLIGTAVSVFFMVVFLIAGLRLLHRNDVLEGRLEVERGKVREEYEERERLFWKNRDLIEELDEAQRAYSALQEKFMGPSGSG